MSDPNILLMQIRVLEEEIAEKDRRIEELECVVAVPEKFLRNQGVWDE